MFSFESDYTEGAHPLILDAFVRTNYEQLSGYGCDKYCDSAKEKSRKPVVKKMLRYFCLQAVHRQISL